ncbi:hypothetical protein JHK82_039603 [Glycine max]|nr:hypothetical protein JHK87_039584 [Glycine soja]KAG4962924.1 hypothetical protein JHK86_039792 [Glycine max]KAG4965396.1 hypothetical protein JHK85_040371 [Glycine max]KAG5110380.1 hypothetical protein JHK82_039603 [Glycine max]KAG5121665.1 hypothetical protein JHK84_040005 [Glycine max]
MVRTRGLGRALGHVTGRGDRDDSDDAPQRQRHTASARRQRVPVTTAHDEPVLPTPDVEADVVPDDPMAPADVEDKTDIPHVPEAGAPLTSARPAVEEPRHAVEVCHGIAERLERHLSLGVVTPGSSTHEVIEECLRMARSVTQDQLVYVRSRRRWRTDQS